MPGSPYSIAVGVACGVAVSFTPLIGLHFLIAVILAWLLGGTVVIEVVFNYPGLGRLIIDAVSDRDLALVQAIALILALLYVGFNLAADLLTLIANPRLRTMRV